MRELSLALLHRSLDVGPDFAGDGHSCYSQIDNLECSLNLNGTFAYHHSQRRCLGPNKWTWRYSAEENRAVLVRNRIKLAQ